MSCIKCVNRQPWPFFPCAWPALSSKQLLLATTFSCWSSSLSGCMNGCFWRKETSMVRSCGAPYLLSRFFNVKTGLSIRFGFFRLNIPLGILGGCPNFFWHKRFLNLQKAVEWCRKFDGFGPAFWLYDFGRIQVYILWNESNINVLLMLRSSFSKYFTKRSELPICFQKPDYPQFSRMSVTVHVHSLNEVSAIYKTLSNRVPLSW